MFEEQRKILQGIRSDRVPYKERYNLDAEFSPVAPRINVQNVSQDFTSSFQKPKDWNEMSFGEKAGATAETIFSGDFVNDWQKLLAGGVKNIGEKSGQILTSPMRVGRLITDKLGVKRDEEADDIIGKLSKIGQVGVEAATRAVPGVSLVGGEELQASREKTDSFGLKLADALGTLGGNLPAFGVLTNAGMKAITFSGILNFASKYPRLYSALANGLAQAGAMSATGQINLPLETEFKDRMKSLVKDASYGGIFGSSGGLFKPFWAAVPAGGAINAVQTYLEGGDKQDITISALIGSAMEGAFRMGNIRNPEVAARNMAADVFSRNGIEIDPKASVADVSKAYNELVNGGKITSVERERLGRAYYILTNTKPELTGQESSDMSASIKKAAEIVKGTREGNAYTGDTVLARQISKIKPEEISTQQDLLDRMREMKVNKDTIKQVADTFNMADTPDAPTKYDGITIEDMKQKVMQHSVLTVNKDTVQSLPVVKDGFVRIFHVGGKDITGGQWVDTVEKLHLDRHDGGDFVVADVPESYVKENFDFTNIDKAKSDAGIMLTKDGVTVPKEYIVASSETPSSSVYKSWEDFSLNDKNIARIKDDPEVKSYLEAIAKEKEIADNLHNNYAQTESGPREGSGVYREPVAQEVTGRKANDKKSSATPAQARTEEPARVQQGAQKKGSQSESDRTLGINVKKYGFSNPERIKKFRQSIDALQEQISKNRGTPLKASEIEAVMETVSPETKVVTKEQTTKNLAALKNAQARIKELEDRADTLEQTGKSLSSDELSELVDLKIIVASHATNFGRNLQAMKMMVHNKSAFDRIIAEAAKKGVDIEVVKQNMNKYNLEDRDGYIQFYRDTFGYTKKEAIDEYVYGNLLSSPRSLMRNAWYGVFTGAVKHPIDLLFKNPTGIPSYYKGMLGSYGDAKQAFVDSWNQVGLNIKGDFDQRVPVSTKSKYWTFGPRLMEASDKFLSTMIRGGEVGRLRESKMSESEIIAEAERFAEDALGRTSFSRENEKYQGKISNFMDSIGRTLNNQHEGFGIGAKFIIRFVRTSVNIGKQNLQSSPVGFLDMATNIHSKTARQNLFAKAMGGTVVSLIALQKALNGETTFLPPTDDKNKEIFYASGRKPFSIKIGDTWFPYVYLGPWAFAITIPAAIAYYTKENKGTYYGSTGDKIESTLSGLMAAYFQTVPIGPLSDLAEALAGNKSGSLEKLGANVVSQFIPFVSLSAYLADVFDPVARKAEGGVETIKRKIPFIKEQLKPYMDLDKTPADYDWSHFVLPYDIGKSDVDGDKLWNKMWIESLKGAFSSQKLKEIESEMEKNKLRQKGYMK